MPADGTDLPLQFDGEDGPAKESTRVLPLSEAEQSFTFVGVAQEPVPSLLRGFSAPVKLVMEQSREALAFRLSHDSDPFNRWEAGQQLATGILLDLVEAHQAGRALVLPNILVESFATALSDTEADPALLALALTLPTETYLAEQMAIIDPEAVHAVREFARQELARRLRAGWDETRQRLQSPSSYSIEPKAVGRRSLKNLALSYLSLLDEPPLLQMCLEQFHGGDNMTDVLAALSCLVQSDSELRQEALAAFYDRWENEPLVVDKWFTLQATSRRHDTLATVRELMGHPAFNIRNPNKVRALIGAFCHGNPALFHASDGRGYDFLADRILELDRLNPQVAARLATALTRWRRYDVARQEAMRAPLERLADCADLSRDVREVVGKSLT